MMSSDAKKEKQRFWISAYSPPKQLPRIKKCVRVGGARTKRGGLGRTARSVFRGSAKSCDGSVTLGLRQVRRSVHSLPSRRLATTGVSLLPLPFEPFAIKKRPKGRSIWWYSVWFSCGEGENGGALLFASYFLLYCCWFLSYHSSRRFSEE